MAKPKKEAPQETMIGHDVFYRVHPASGKPYVNETRAWDVERFRANLCKSHLESKDGPAVVEFITREDYNKERAKGIRK